MNHVVIYTDGACKGNPGPGGWGVYLKAGGHEKELWGGERETTNNRMELTAVIEALGALKRPGLIMGVFIAGYGVARFAVEFVRQADAQFITEGNPMGWVVEFGGFGLSQGQLLSLPMIVVAGAGVVGLASALAIARRGRPVRVDGSVDACGGRRVRTTWPLALVLAPLPLSCSTSTSTGST